MSVKYQAVNYANTQANPLELIEEGQMAGTSRIMYDTFTLTADLAAGDTILVGAPLPEGAVLVDCKIWTVAGLGGSCTVDVGWQAGATALEAAAPTGFFSALPVSAANTYASAYGSSYQGSTFLYHTLQEAVQPVIAEHAVSSGATGNKISIAISYNMGD